MNPRCVVVDANITFRALAAGRGDLRDRLGPGASADFFSPRFLFVELFKHKERLTKAAKVTEEEMLNALHTLVSRLEFVFESLQLRWTVLKERHAKQANDDGPAEAGIRRLPGRGE